MKWEIDPADPFRGRYYRISDPPRFHLAMNGPTDRAVYVLVDGQERACVGTREACDAQADRIAGGRLRNLSASKE